MVDPVKVVDWAFDTGLYQPKPINPRDQLRRRVSRHLGHRYMTDPQGRTVRALLAVPVTDDADGTRKYGYFPLFQTLPGRVEVGLKLRTRWAFKRVEQIEIDWSSYNDNNIFGVKIAQLDFNFEQALVDAKMPTEWSDNPPDGIDDEDDNWPRQRALTPLAEISLRLAALSFLARTFPPFEAPKRLSVSAA